MLRAGGKANAQQSTISQLNLRHGLPLQPPKTVRGTCHVNLSSSTAEIGRQEPPISDPVLRRKVQSRGLPPTMQVARKAGLVWSAGLMSCTSSLPSVRKESRPFFSRWRNKHSFGFRSAAARPGPRAAPNRGYLTVSEAPEISWAKPPFTVWNCSAQAEGAHRKPRLSY